MTQLSEPPEQDGLLPLLSLAPAQTGTLPPSQTGAAGYARQPVHLRGQTVPILRKGEFGYDIRLEVPGPDGVIRPVEPVFVPPKPQREKKQRNLKKLAMMAALGGAAAAFGLTQPSVRASIGKMLNHSQPVASATPAPSPSGLAYLPPGLAGLQPSSKASPVATPKPSPTATATPTPAPTTAPTAAPLVESGPVTIQVTGTYTVAANGATTTHCQQGTSAKGVCTWNVIVQPGNSFHATLQWTGGENLSFQVFDSSGNQLFTNSSTSGSVAMHLDSPPSPLRVVVTVNSGTNVQFSLTVANHAI